jgi:hypothetical protein
LATLSETPAKILELAQNWAHLDQKATTSDSPRYRFFLVVDDEVIDHLLQLPTPAEIKKGIPFIYSVKVYDARHNSPPEFSYDDEEEESDSDSDSNAEYPVGGIEDDFEGYFWCPATYLPELWFCDYQNDMEELLSTDDSWDATRRFVPSKVALKHNLPLIERRRELAAMKRTESS